MNRRRQLTVLAIVVVFLFAAAVGGTHRRNAPHGTPQPARPAVTPSPHPHEWEAKR